MNASAALLRTSLAPDLPYRLDEQVGFILRQVSQRHASLFAAAFGDELTPTQWAALAKLREVGACSQNHLGRLVAMDVATVKGVVERLARRGYVAFQPDPADRRRIVITLTGDGEAAYARLEPVAARVTEETLQPLSPEERRALMPLLVKLR